MAGYGKDEVPMLSDTHPPISSDDMYSQSQKPFSRTRSASVSIVVNPVESYDNSTFVGYTGPLYINRKIESSLIQNLGVPAQKSIELKVEKFPSFSGMDQK